MFDATGDVLRAQGSTDGLYHRDTRHLSRFNLSLGGARPMLLSSILRDDNPELTVSVAREPFFLVEGQV